MTAKFKVGDRVVTFYDEDTNVEGEVLHVYHTMVGDVFKPAYSIRLDNGKKVMRAEERLTPCGKI